MKFSDLHVPDNRKPHEIAQTILKMPVTSDDHIDGITLPSLSFTEAFTTKISSVPIYLAVAVQNSQVDMQSWYKMIARIGRNKSLTADENTRFTRHLLTDLHKVREALFSLRRNMELHGNPYGHTRNEDEHIQAEARKETLREMLYHRSPERMAEQLLHIQAGADMDRQIVGRVADTIANVDAITDEIRALATAMKLDLTEPGQSK